VYIPTPLRGFTKEVALLIKKHPVFEKVHEILREKGVKFEVADFHELDTSTRAEKVRVTHSRVIGRHKERASYAALAQDDLLTLHSNAIVQVVLNKLGQANSCELGLEGDSESIGYWNTNVVVLPYTSEVKEGGA
jgi:hypothetical protein